MSTTAPAVRPDTRPSALLQATRVLFALFGTVKLAGTAYFTFVASAEQGGDPQGLADWSVVGWSTLLALAYLAVAVRLGSGSRRLLAAAGALIVTDVVFSIVKITAYDEQEAAGFLGVSLLLFALLVLALRARR